MPNALNSTGLTVVTQSELYSILSSGMQAIYGTDINLASDSPDGQMLNLFIQAILDNAELTQNVNTSFDPDQAIGTILDQRVAINGIQRQAGTFTVTPITVVNSQSVNLYGVDQSAQAIYTVSDLAGNLWQLQTTTLGLAAGTHVLNFQAATPGAITTTPNTITIQVTVVLGVTSVNNPTTYSVLGLNEESDAVLKVRRAKSVSLASQGYYNGLVAALLNIPGMSSAFVYENFTASTDANGVPGHSIWVITAGTATPANIAQAIYTKRNAGCGMKGSQTYTLVQINSTPFTVFWDDVIVQNLFIIFTATSLNGTTSPNIGAIVAGLPSSFVPGVFQEVNINALATQVQILDPNTLVTNSGFSIAQTQVLTLSGVAASGAFAISYNGNASASISWNDSISTIQNKVQAVTGLTSALVTGSIASQTLTFNLTAIIDVLALIKVVSNTLQTSAPAAITFSYSMNSYTNYSTYLTPSSKQYQFVTASANIIVLPMVLSPLTSTVAPTVTVAFQGYGGYSTYVYSISINNSGASINSSTGLYTAGSTPLVTDTVKVTDSFGNTATATVTVS